MPVTEGKYQCEICEDIFEATSDSFSKCKCGESEIKPSYIVYTYRNGNRVKTIDQNTYYLEDDFVKPPEDIRVIYEEIKRIKEANGYKYYLFEMSEKGKNGEKYLSQINVSYSQYVSTYSSESNEISLALRLRKEDYRGHDITKKRLQRFLDMMNAIESGELDVSKRGKMVELADNENIDYREEPTGETNYTFYF